MPDEVQLFASVPTPTPGVDTRVSLATAMYAAPGVYAVLVGSGMSTAAGIPTGWQVVQNLIRQVARAQGASDDDVGDRPEDWWESQGLGVPRYDKLLQALAPTDPARQMLLRQYFDPPPPNGPIEPTPAHQALGWLCANGFVRIVLTTNFDRLIERALEEAGAAPQVISSAGAVAGMTPLQHAQTTVIKLHGDWATSGMRNTPEELAEYPAPIHKLLDRVFDEYGLLVVGWSAEWDVALCQAILECPSRRYPTYWAMYGSELSEAARRLTAQRPTGLIETAGANEFLPDLTQRISRLAERATRQARPSALRIFRFMLAEHSPPEGWDVLPLLQLRSVAVVPASLEACGEVSPRERAEILTTLRGAALTARLYGLAVGDTLSAEAADSEKRVQMGHEPLGEWRPTPGGHQSIDCASYRLGGDAKRGISALVSVRLPGVGQGGSVVFTIDMAISMARFLRLGEVALLWRDGLILTSAALPEAIGGVLPSDAEVTVGEVHVLAAETDGHNNTRPNRMTERIDLASLGSPSRPLAPSMGYAFQMSGSLTEHAAAEVVVDAIEHMAWSHGYLDTDSGIAVLRAELGLPTPTRT